MKRSDLKTLGEVIEEHRKDPEFNDLWVNQCATCDDTGYIDDPLSLRRPRPLLPRRPMPRLQSGG